ncbi:alpha/beta hydrolase family esterase [Chitinophaga ginsengisoli]|uniref:Polyhydroxybutyrate depolymerase n=1 Tax=Chitinophaga ginsengisoli TaxID=363837 RepID=A0A2P8FUJ0_9BACT|nr:PHB depolymerase family esterase [Chitinophaga ginsengisoli]PSL25389.1 polyhydroxybutyrate depolymerase [Chitinophaga ginsengisoli]
MIIAISIISLIVLICLTLFLYWAYAPTPKAPRLLSKISKEEILIGTEKRTYWKYVPTRLSKRKVPLVIVLHGSGIDGARIRAWTGYEFDLMADEYGFAVAYPDGYKHNWNDIRKNAPFPAKKKNIDDVGFIKSLIESYRLTHDIDLRQVYVFGYSNGGTMALRLAISEPGLLAGLAISGSNLPTDDNLIDNLRAPMPPVLMVNGTADPIIPYEGGNVRFFGKDLGNVISALATAEAIAESHNGPKTTQTVRLPHLNPDDLTTAERKVWLQDEQKLVALYTVHGGGHVVPQSIAKFPRLMGKANRDFSAPREAVNFWGLNRL